MSLFVVMIGLLGTILCAQDQPTKAIDLENGLVIHLSGPVDKTSDKVESYGALSSDALSISVWVRADEAKSVSGDLLSWYDQKSYIGGHLSMKSDTGVTSSQTSSRHLQFGIDDGSSTRWTDCGAPGNALLAFSMAVHQGQLFAGTCEPGKEDYGQVYRYAGGQQWISCGRLDDSNSVTSLAVFNDQLFAGTGRYRVAGSSLPESENRELGGRVFRYLGNNAWELAGQLPEVEAIGGLVVYREHLYASSLYKPAGFYRMDGNTWTKLPVPQLPNSQTGEIENIRVVSLTVHEDSIYAGSYDCGHVFKYDGNSWQDCGQLGQNTQTYGFIRYQGSLLASTWPSGRVYRLNQAGQWDDFGRLGEELEVMGMMVYNGRLFGGTLPGGQVFTLDPATPPLPPTWRLSQTLDTTPNVKYRRAWTMAEQGGLLFCSTLPSGKVFSAEHGVQVNYDSIFPSGWHHVMATKNGQILELYIDGTRVGQRRGQLKEIEQSSTQKLTIGNGPSGPFVGDLKDLRVYRRILNDQEIRQLSLNKL